MAQSDLWNEGRVLIAGDSRVRRLQSMPDPLLITNVDFVFAGGIVVDDLINLVDQNLTEEHSIIIVIGFIGDEVMKYSHSISDDSTVTLIRSNESNSSEKIVEAVRCAHTRWMAEKTNRTIVWTIPYYVDYAAYNSAQVGEYDVGTTMDVSWDSAVRFVRYVTRLRLQWVTANPNITFCLLNEAMFDGKNNRALYKSFGSISGEDFRFPNYMLSDGLHPTAKLTSLMWALIHKAVGVTQQREVSRLQITAPDSSHADIDSSISLHPNDDDESLDSFPLEKCTVSGWKSKSGRGKSTRKPFYQKRVFKQNVTTVHSRIAYPLDSSEDTVEEGLVEENYGNLSWKASNSNLSEASTSSATASKVQRGPAISVPLVPWSWAYHRQLVAATKAKCYTQGVREQIWAESRLSSMIREKGLLAASEGHIPSFNKANRQWSTNAMEKINKPPPKSQLIQKDLAELLSEEDDD